MLRLVRLRRSDQRAADAFGDVDAAIGRRLPASARRELRAALAFDENIDAAMFFIRSRCRRAAGERRNTRYVPCACVDQRRNMRGQSFVEESELKVAVVNGDRVAVVGILGLTVELERRAGVQAGDEILAALERYARDLRMEVRRIADRGVWIAQILVALGKDAFDQCARGRLRCAGYAVDRAGYLT